ncbi:MAG: hypothetical protein JXR41_12495 [Bacteroidales bacterium]|nr:hypothetical protein [Bacteroidales bacterium]MBN2763905.1 hypothetical protein [Bacteroidales bacterium]
MTTQEFNPIPSVTAPLEKAEQAMGNGDLAKAFELIEKILEEINSRAFINKTKDWDNGHRAFLLDITNRCIFLKQKLIKEMAKNL